MNKEQFKRLNKVARGIFFIMQGYILLSMAVEVITSSMNYKVIIQSTVTIAAFLATFIGYKMHRDNIKFAIVSYTAMMTSFLIVSIFN